MLQYKSVKFCYIEYINRERVYVCVLEEEKKKNVFLVIKKITSLVFQINFISNFRF